MKYFSAFAVWSILSWGCQGQLKIPAGQNRLSEEDSISYVEAGIAITTSTFQTLSGALKQALEEGGTAHAIQYCNLNAFPIVDSLSNQFGAQIRRTSSRVRNPENEPNAEEVKVIERFSNMGNSQNKLGPLVKQQKGSTTFYAPILTAPLCLKCHGTIDKDISKVDATLLATRYPQDKAIGYKAGDLRGIWSITFNK